MNSAGESCARVGAAAWMEALQAMNAARRLQNRPIIPDVPNPFSSWKPTLQMGNSGRIACICKLKILSVNHFISFLAGLMNFWFFDDRGTFLSDVLYTLFLEFQRRLMSVSIFPDLEVPNLVCGLYV